MEIQLISSIKQKQLLVDTIIEHCNHSGVCPLSQSELSKCIQLSQTWVSSSIKFLNREDQCIAYENGGYKVNYRNIAHHGSYKKIIQLIIDFLNKKIKMETPTVQLSTRYRMTIANVEAGKSFTRDIIKQLISSNFKIDDIYSLL